MLIDFKNLNIHQLKPQNQFEEKLLELIRDWFSNSSILSVQTSGSTGTPKVFDVEKQKMLNSAKMTCDFLDLKENDSALICLPVEYISGKMMVVRAIERNLKLIFAEPSTTPLEDLEREVDFCAMTPLQVENSIDKIHLIKNLIIGGAAVSENLKVKIAQTLKRSNSPTKIFETYGMSESLSHIALKEIYPNSEKFFTVLDEVQISLDERGCLKIFASKLNSEILTTNDLVEVVGEKQFRFLGRIDNVINSGGAKIFPEELEALVKREIENEVAFFGIPDETLGQKLILVIEGISTPKIIHQLSLIIYSKSFHKPKEIIFVEKLPRTPNGKIDRIKLRKKLNY